MVLGTLGFAILNRQSGGIPSNAVCDVVATGVLLRPKTAVLAIRDCEDRSKDAR